MSPRRFGYGDKVFVVIEGTVESFEESFDELTVQYRTELGAYETTLAVDSDALQLHHAAEVTTEYGVRGEYGETFGNHSKDEQKRRVDHLRSKGANASPVSRLVTPWVEGEDRS